MRKSILQRIDSLCEAALARLGHSFIDHWGALQQRYRRVYAHIAMRLRYAFFPLLALAALGWLAWDWQHDRQLASAEDAIFDQIIGFRPWEPKPSRQVVVVEIDECSIQYMREQGAGGWPWSRQLHADLIDVLDRAGVRAVGFDVQFTDPSAQDPLGDATLEAMAEGGAGRFVFGSTRLHPDYDRGSPLRASQAPSSYPLMARPRNDPAVALLLPYGKAMAGNSALLNVTRGGDGVLRDVPLREQVGDWALASLPLRLATGGNARAMAASPGSIRIDWRTRSKLPYASAADLLTGRAICRSPSEPLPALAGRTVLVGYTAAGLNDAKPTPAGLMPGVEVHAEATEALLAGSAIWLPPAWLKYALAAVLLLLTTFAFFRGEPAYEIDDVFVATNLVLLIAAFVGLTAFRVFFDIFAAIGFVSLYFGLCRLYAGVQRGRAIGNNDFRAQFDPARDRVLALARVRFVPDAKVNPRGLERRLREYRRRLRRYVHGGLDAVMLEGVVERKSWLWEAMEDVTVLVWTASDRATAAAMAERELDGLHAHLVAHDDTLPDDGSVHVAIAFSDVGNPDPDFFEVRAKVRSVLGTLLAERTEWPLSARNSLSSR
ncbi:CHASE2 domain-containing protein [Lysobacter niabensis]|uniref:CHASE2 domain-containing protein n=1 Tax=Agrilutibacter niabensis TaxID=380628 RepID=UPI0036153A30